MGTVTLESTRTGYFASGRGNRGACPSAMAGRPPSARTRRDSVLMVLLLQGRSGPVPPGARVGERWQELPGAGEPRTTARGGGQRPAEPSQSSWILRRLLRNPEHLPRLARCSDLPIHLV